MESKADSTQFDDRDLLRQFVDCGDEQALRALVNKYAGLVYGVAMRRTGKPEAAEEIAQNVLLAFSLKAASLIGPKPLGAWLHRAATLESLKYLRRSATQQRHLAMIREHQEQQDHSSGDAKQWQEIRPYLDELLNRLSASDREILVEHYFEGKQFKEIAVRIGINPDAAQKRSVRALEKLARLLAKRGVTVSSAFLTLGLSTELSTAAPQGFASKVGSSVLSATATSASTTTFTSALAFMSTSKLAFASAFVIAASVPVGLRIAESKVSASVKLNHPSSATSTQVLQQQSPNNTSFDAERFRKALAQHQSSEVGNDAQARRLQRFIFSLELNEVVQAVAVLEEFENPERLLNIVSAAFARWAELDPEEAVADAHARPKSQWGFYPINGAWHTWAFSDWDAARAWNATNNDSFEFWSHLDWMAERDGEVAVQHATELAEDFPSDGESYIRRALKSWTQSDPDTAIAWMDENLTDPVKRDDYLGGSLQQLGKRDPVKALDQVNLIENPDRLDEVRYNLYWSWAHLQPTEAANYLSNSKAGENWSPSNLHSAGEVIARNLPVRALEIARGIEDAERRDNFYCGILCGAIQSNLSLVREAAEAISEQSARTNNSLRTFLDHWAAEDREAAMAWVDALPEGGKKEWARHFFPRK